jgi:rSAM/selenodomain-associated transferase 1
VKTRLCPPLTPEAAAALQRACLADLWDRLNHLNGIHRVLCHDPPNVAGRFRELLGEETCLLAQSEGDLGERLVAAFDALFREGHGPIAAVGADSPDLPLATVSRAIEALETGDCDVAIGPADDGGYTLIALRQPEPQLFRNVPWSTADVFSSTLARCREAALRVLTLDPWYDVDDAATLARLRNSVRNSPAELPRLRRWFADVERG